MDVLRAPYKKLILVCSHFRDDGRPCCGAREAGEIHIQLKRRIAALDLADPVRVSRTGCLDLCSLGPVVVVYPEGRVYAGVELSDIDRIIRELFGPADLPEEPLV